MPPLDMTTKPTTETKSSEVSKFHLELNMTKEQVKTAETICAGALGVVAIAACGPVGSKVKELIERVGPVVVDGADGLWADTLRLTKAAPKTNFYQLKNGLQVKLVPNLEASSSQADLISISQLDKEQRLLTEVKIFRNGSRIVNEPWRSKVFHDEAGKGMWVDYLDGSPAQSFKNEHMTILNKKMFKTLENSFLTGSTKPIESPDLLKRASYYSANPNAKPL